MLDKLVYTGKTIDLKIIYNNNDIYDKWFTLIKVKRKYDNNFWNRRDNFL